MPATEQLNIRVPAGTKARFRERALREGMSQAQLLEALLAQRGPLELPPQETLNGNGPPDVVPPPVPETIDFALWLQSKTGIAKALTARAVAAGRVTVAGVPFTAPEIPRKLLATTVVVYEEQELA